jgi:hypothetical protein
VDNVTNTYCIMAKHGGLLRPPMLIGTDELSSGPEGGGAVGRQGDGKALKARGRSWRRQTSNGNAVISRQSLRDPVSSMSHSVMSMLRGWLLLTAVWPILAQS